MSLADWAALAIIGYIVLDILAVIAIAIVAYRRRRTLRWIVDRWVAGSYVGRFDDRRGEQFDSIGD